MSDKGEEWTTVGHRSTVHVWQTGFGQYPHILYFGNWEGKKRDPNCHRSNTQYNAFEFSFKGPSVRWIGSKDVDHGTAEVYVDGEHQATVDAYSAEPQSNAVKYEKTDLAGDRIHTLRVVVTKDRHPDATDCYQDVTYLQCLTPVSYPAEITRAMAAEYAEIQAETKAYLAPEDWSPVANAANAPQAGVRLGPGVLGDVFSRNIDYLNHSFSSPTYCDGVGWSAWLPASNEGRMLAGAGNALRWGERADLRAIVDTIVPKIEARMREDGFYNYYPESDSYALPSGRNSERKNYDRVFWTRGLLAAGAAGHPGAFALLRRMYDWFNASPYLPQILLGGNATNGLPGGPMMALSPVGKPRDQVVTERYQDQDYWIDALTHRESLCLSHYPGERPHCYDLLGLEAFTCFPIVQG